MNVQKFAIIGLGGLGVPAFLRLISSDLNIQISVYEQDTVDLSNLHRQIIFKDEHVGTPKLDVLEKLFPDASLTLNSYFITTENISELLKYDLVLDCTDDPKIKLLLNDFCKINHIPLVHAGAQGEDGFLLMIADNLACLRCVFGDVDGKDIENYCSSCRISGILGAYSGLTGVLQAEMALDYLANKDFPYKAIKIDTKGTRQIDFEKSNTCLLCSSHRTLNLREIECPQTFVYTKLALMKRENKDEHLVISFSSVESLNNVEKSIKEEGFSVINRIIIPELEVFKLLLK
jgi:molybdopterin/thiamine biosynthesis adenylyltransferase